MIVAHHILHTILTPVNDQHAGEQRVVMYYVVTKILINY